MIALCKVLHKGLAQSLTRRVYAKPYAEGIRKDFIFFLFPEGIREPYAGPLRGCSLNTGVLDVWMVYAKGIRQILLDQILLNRNIVN